MVLLCKNTYIETSIEARPAHGHVGLWNQGATCYLNSVVQVLCSDADFSNALFNCECEDGSVTKELQRLFTTLRKSNKMAVSTEQLTASFGWQNGQMHEQHDAHELFVLLLDSMTNASVLKSFFEYKVIGNERTNIILKFLSVFIEI